jgi:hypothetical protein
MSPMKRLWGQPAAKRSWYKSVHLRLSHLIALLSSAFVILFDPFSLDDGADALDEDSANIFYAATYGTPVGNGTSNKGQDAIVVVLIDDAYLAATGATWPVAPSVYRGLLRRLAGAGSAGIYLDIRFQVSASEKQREAELGDLYQAAADLQARSDVKIVFSGNLSSPIPIFNGTAPTRTALLQMPGARGSYSLQQNFELMKDGRYRHLQSLEHAQDPHAIRSINTAAYEMFSIWCVRHETECGDSADSLAVHDKMPLQWGYAPDELMFAHYRDVGQTCQASGTGWWQRMKNTVEVVTARLFGGGAATDRSPCLYHRNFNADFISRLEMKELRSLVEGKIVFIGADVSAAPDETYSPVHLYVPGVFRHAMALDNLIERGSAWLVLDPDLLNYAEILLLTAVLFSHLRFQQWLAVAVPDGEKVQLETLYGVSVLLLLALLCGMSIYWFHAGPSTWLSYLSMWLGVGYPGLIALGVVTYRFYASGIPVPLSTPGTVVREAAIWGISLVCIGVGVLAVLTLLVLYLLTAVGGAPEVYGTATALLAAGLCMAIILLGRQLRLAEVRQAARTRAHRRTLWKKRKRPVLASRMTATMTARTRFENAGPVRTAWLQRRLGETSAADEI